MENKIAIYACTYSDKFYCIPAQYAATVKSKDFKFVRLGSVDELDAKGVRMHGIFLEWAANFPALVAKKDFCPFVKTNWYWIYTTKEQRAEFDRQMEADVRNIQRWEGMDKLINPKKYEAVDKFLAVTRNMKR